MNNPGTRAFLFACLLTLTRPVFAGGVKAIPQIARIHPAPAIAPLPASAITVPEFVKPFETVS